MGFWFVRVVPKYLNCSTVLEGRIIKLNNFCNILFVFKFFKIFIETKPAFPFAVSLYVCMSIKSKNCCFTPKYGNWGSHRAYC
jgi:hypothetical protein